MAEQRIYASIDEASARRIGHEVGSAVADRLEPALSELRTAINRLTAEQGKIKEEIAKLKAIEIAKAEAKRAKIREIETDIKQLESNADTLFKHEEKEIKTDYDETIREKIDGLANSISANTASIKQLGSELDQFEQLKNSMFEMVDKLRGVHAFNCSVRLSRIRSKKEEILGNLEKFLTERKEIVDRITNFQTLLPHHFVASGESIIFYMPFWVVGLDDGHTEEIQVFPIQKVITPEGIPTRDKPYVEHLAPHDTYCLDENYIDAIKYFRDLENVKIAKEQSILKEKDALMPNMNNLATRGYVDSTNVDGTSTFIEVLNRFIPVASTFQQISAPLVSHVPSVGKTVAKPITIKCPKCRGIIEVVSPERPLQIICPHCGTQGILRE